MKYLLLFVAFLVSLTIVSSRYSSEGGGEVKNRLAGYILTVDEFLNGRIEGENAIRQIMDFFSPSQTTVWKGEKSPQPVTYSEIPQSYMDIDLDFSRHVLPIVYVTTYCGSGDIYTTKGYYTHYSSRDLHSNGTFITTITFGSYEHQWVMDTDGVFRMINFREAIDKIFPSKFPAGQQIVYNPGEE
jgi:hypothetical protein